MRESNQKTRALKEIVAAENMIVEKDYASAREHLIKARGIFPGIDYIESMLAVCDILCAASIDLYPGGGIDHYWILQVSPSANWSNIKYHQQKLFSMLQPIRNTFPGAELALKHVQEAYYTLSDYQKRYRYDSKRAALWEDYSNSSMIKKTLCQTMQDKAATADQISSTCKRITGSCISNESVKKTEMLPKLVKELSKKQLDHEEGEYQSGKNILHTSNLSTADFNSVDETEDRADTDVRSLQSTVFEGIASSSIQIGFKESRNQDFYNFDNERITGNFEAGQIIAAPYGANLQHGYQYALIHSRSDLFISVTWLKPVPVTSAERRWCDIGLRVACGSFELDAEMTEELRSPAFPFYQCSWTQGVTKEIFEIYPRKGEVWAIYKEWDLDEWSYNPDAGKGCKFLLVEIMSEFSKYFGADATCLETVSGFKTIFERQKIRGNPVTFHIPATNLYMFSHRIPAYRFRGGEMDDVVADMLEVDMLALTDNLTQGQDMSRKKAPVVGKSTLPSTTPVAKSCPESKTLKLGLPRKGFGIGQIWATYSGKDSMPWQYVRVDSLTSESHLEVALLEPVPSLDHEINWKEEDLPISCGIFKVGKTSVNLQVSLFSHSVQCLRSTCKSFYKIYPQKGEIWAMLIGWNSKWTSQNYENHRCQIVEILTDLSEDGVRVAKLERMKGLLTFFHRVQSDGLNLIHAVGREDMLSFSHQIPAFRVPGIAKYGIPEDSWHLDPDALPHNPWK